MNDVSMSTQPWFEAGGKRYVGKDILSTPVREEPLLIVGDGPSKHTHIYELDTELFRVMSVNRGVWGTCLQAHYLATMHGEHHCLTHVMPLAPFGKLERIISWTQHGDEHPRVTDVVDGDPLCGTSSLLAVLAGLWLGYRDITLAGCDMSDGYGSPMKLAAWRKWAPVFKGHVQSMGGRLVEIL